MTEIGKNKEVKAGLLLRVLLVTVAALGLGALLAPIVFNGLIWLGRQFSLLENLRDVEFEKVAGRCFLILLLLGVVVTVRLAGLHHRNDLGYPKGQKFGTRLNAGWWLGCLSIACIYLVAWRSGFFRITSEWNPALPGKIIGYIFGALLVGIIEETLFRGIIFGLVRRFAGFWISSIFASLIFSLVHFARTNPPVGVVYGHWNSGLKMLPHMFGGINWDAHFFPFSLTLFMMGLILCAIYDRQKSLYFVIGLHAGWVWLMKMGSYFFDPVRGAVSWFYGDCEVISKSYAALILSVIMLGVVLIWRSRTARGFEERA